MNDMRSPRVVLKQQIRFFVLVSAAVLGACSTLLSYGFFASHASAAVSVYSSEQCSPQSNPPTQTNEQTDRVYFVGCADFF